MSEIIEAPHVYNNRTLRNVLSLAPNGRGPANITSAQDWAQKRASLAETIGEFLGTPSTHHPPRAGFRVVEEVKEPTYRQLKIRYEVERDDEVSAWLLIPPVNKRQKGAAVLCQHGTAAEAKDQQIGAGAKPGRDFARLLAMHGFVTLAPDHFCAGERHPTGFKPFETASLHERHPDWSAVGKTIWDGQRAVDVLSEIDEVDAARIGSVGHSLGGYGSFFLGAFDPRINAVVSSCGLTSWQDNSAKAANWSRDTWYCHFPKLRTILEQPSDLPFDLHEFAALMAPRPFLNISGLADPMYGNNQTLGDIGLQLHALWSLLGQPEAFANFLFGGGHDVPHYSRALMIAWLERWLVHH